MLGETEKCGDSVLKGRSGGVGLDCFLLLKKKEEAPDRGTICMASSDTLPLTYAPYATRTDNPS